MSLSMLWIFNSRQNKLINMNLQQKMVETTLYYSLSVFNPPFLKVFVLIIKVLKRFFSIVYCKWWRNSNCLTYRHCYANWAYIVSIEIIIINHFQLQKATLTASWTYLERFKPANSCSKDSRWDSVMVL